MALSFTSFWGRKNIFCADLARSWVFLRAQLKGRGFNIRTWVLMTILGIIWVKALGFPHTSHLMVAHGNQVASEWAPSSGPPLPATILQLLWASESQGCGWGVAGFQRQSLTQEIWVSLKMFISDKFPCDAAAPELVQSLQVWLYLP